MNKKSNYLIIALIFIVLAMGWQLYIRTQPTEQEQKEAKKEAEKIPEPAGQKTYEYSSFSDTIYNTGLKIGVKNISIGFVDCTINSADQQNRSKYLDVGENYPFVGNDGEKYIVSYDVIRKDDQNREYVIFQISPDKNALPNYEEKRKQENQDKQKNIDDAIKKYESRINEKIEDAFLDSNEKDHLDREYRDNWDASKTQKCTINNIKQYREKLQELPQGYSLNEYYLTYYFKVSVDTPDGIKEYRCDFKVGVTYDNRQASINDKIDVISFDEI